MGKSIPRRNSHKFDAGSIFGTRHAGQPVPGSEFGTRNLFFGKAFATYRRRRGASARVLPDFLIGAHAAVADLRLITRDRISG
jgi:hypothetical protein